MKRFKTTYFTRLLSVKLMLALCSLSLSVAASAAPLKIGDDYGGGKIALILSPGDAGYADLAEHFMIPTKSDISETDEWAESKEAHDSMEEAGHVGIYLKHRSPQNHVAVGGYEQ